MLAGERKGTGVTQESGEVAAVTQESGEVAACSLARERKRPEGSHLHATGPSCRILF